MPNGVTRRKMHRALSLAHRQRRQNCERFGLPLRILIRRLCSPWSAGKTSDTTAPMSIIAANRLFRWQRPVFLGSRRCTAHFHTSPPNRTFDKHSFVQSSDRPAASNYSYAYVRCKRWTLASQCIFSERAQAATSMRIS